jgi:type VI protein secretion system component Hcp
MTSVCPRLSRLSIAFFAATALVSAPATAAAYLKLGDIKGQSSAGPGRGGEIQIESWSWGETRVGGKMHLEDISAAPKNRAKSYSSGVEREMKESGEKGGTEDMNIGIGELQEMTISKSSDKATPKLYESAAKGKVFKSPAAKGSMTTKVPAGTCKLGARYPTAELGTGEKVYTMTGVVVTGCATASDGSIPTETLSLNYDKITWK